jgi:hypothetical protein
VGKAEPVPLHTEHTEELPPKAVAANGGPVPTLGALPASPPGVAFPAILPPPQPQASARRAAGIGPAWPAAAHAAPPMAAACDDSTDQFADFSAAEAVNEAPEAGFDAWIDGGSWDDVQSAAVDPFPPPLPAAVDPFLPLSALPAAALDSGSNAASPDGNDARGQDGSLRGSIGEPVVWGAVAGPGAGLGDAASGGDDEYEEDEFSDFASAPAAATDPDPAPCVGDPDEKGGAVSGRKLAGEEAGAGAIVAVLLAKVPDLSFMLADDIVHPSGGPGSPW